MSTITLSDSFNVLFDGVAKGALADTIHNHPELTSDIQRAIPVKLAELAQRSADALKAEQDKGAATAKDLSDKLSTLQADFNAYKQATEELVTLSRTDPEAAANAAQAKLAQNAADRQRATLLAKKAAIESQLAAL